MPATECRRHIRLAIVTIAALAVLGASRGPIPVERTAASQVAGDSAEWWRISLSTWLRAVERHKPAQRDTDLVAIAAFSWNDLNGVLADYLALFKLVEPRVRKHLKVRSADHVRLPVRRLHGGRSRAFALLHRAQPQSRPGLQARCTAPHGYLAARRRPVERPAATMDTGVVVVRDGQRIGFDYFAQHLAFARALLDHVSPDPAGDSMVRLWYRAIAAFLAGEWRLGDADRHLQRAREIFPADAQILLASGCLHEAFASAKIQSSIETLQLPRGMLVGVGSSGRELRQATSYFRQALKADETLTPGPRSACAGDRAGGRPCGGGTRAPPRGGRNG